MDRKPMKIRRIVNEGRNTKTFIFDEELDACPGQFVMAWIPGKSEKPYSISYNNPLGITAKKFCGPESTFTPALFDMVEGDKLWIRGPLGKGFPLDRLEHSDVYLVGGGTGVAPLANLAESLDCSRITSFIGARSVEDMIFQKRLKMVGEVIVTTEDGSYGEKGVVTDAIKKEELSKGGSAAVCGPEKMNFYASKLLSERIDPDQIYISMERLMKCGTALCGSCDLGGYAVCKDGPVFKWQNKYSSNYIAIKDVQDFGKFKRDRFGSKEFL
jgi:dihydroorotate dehydrogenase electron transfer subunit